MLAVLQALIEVAWANMQHMLQLMTAAVSKPPTRLLIMKAFVL